MAVVTIQATGICAGGNHVALTASIAGGASQTQRFITSELMAAVAGTDARDVILALLRVHAIGKTPAQVRSNLQAGITVTI